jgi:hypothetical protein
MSQIRPNAPLCYLDQDHITIEELLALRTGLGAGNTVESPISASKAQNEPTATKIDQHDNSLPHRHFIEYLAGMIKKSPQEYDENLKTLSL